MAISFGARTEELRERKGKNQRKLEQVNKYRHREL
jgi:hypothetical protein